MDFFALAAARSSCRAFDPNTAVDPADLRRITEAARLSPSACNSQPWHFTVVSGGPVLEAVRTAAQSLGINTFTADCPAFIVINEEPVELPERVGDKRYAPYDLGIVTAHICLAAQELGLSTCILGGFSGSKMAKACGIDSSKYVPLAVCVGHAASGAFREKSRKRMGALATFIEE
ncbi:MAG: nitroreductase family protein [Clostridia bacterium]|nr:nitroreductase family protein [Clostridia bacterium]